MSNDGALNASDTKLYSLALSSSPRVKLIVANSLCVCVCVSVDSLFNVPEHKADTCIRLKGHL